MSSPVLFPPISPLRGYGACPCLCLLLTALQTLWGAAPPASEPLSPVTVLLSYERPYSRSSFEALQQQLQHVLNDVGIKLEIRERQAAVPHEQFSDLFLFQMKGRCSMDGLPVGALSDERGALAMAYSQDGNILPFGEVECDRVRESLQRLVGRSHPEAYQSAFGALGMVMAHEIYHMLAHSPHHTRQGVTKESLSARELLDRDLPLPDVARLAMRQTLARER